jgi:hypothetical protein
MNIFFLFKSRVFSFGVKTLKNRGVRAFGKNQPTFIEVKAVVRKLN